MHLPHLVWPKTPHSEQHPPVRGPHQRRRGEVARAAASHLGYLEPHLPKLIDLKHRSRTPNGLQDTAPQQALARPRKENNRHPSRLVYPHNHLFRKLIAESPE